MLDLVLVPEETLEPSGVDWNIVSTRHAD